MNPRVANICLYVVKSGGVKTRYRVRAKGRIRLINCLEQRVSQELITMRRTSVGVKKISHETS